MNKSTYLMPNARGFVMAAAMSAALAVVVDDPASAATAVAKPGFSLKAGKYRFVQTVDISDKTDGASIYYTTDGTTPTASSTPYTGALAVGVTETLKAIAVATGHPDSAIASATYTIACGTIAKRCLPALTGTNTAGQSAFDLYADIGTGSVSTSGTIVDLSNTLLNYRAFAASPTLPYSAADSTSVPAYFPVIGDQSGNLWSISQSITATGEYSNSIAIVEFANASGHPASISPSTTTTLPAGSPLTVPHIAIDQSGNLWLDEIDTATTAASIVEYTIASGYQSVGTTIAYSGTGGESGGCEGASLAFTSAGHLEALESYSNGAGGCSTQMVEYTSSGSKVASIYFPASYQGNYGDLAIDAAGNLWVFSQPNDCDSSGCSVAGAIYEVSDKGVLLQTIVPPLPSGNNNEEQFGNPVLDANGNVWFSYSSERLKYCKLTDTESLYEISAGSSSLVQASQFTGSCEDPLTRYLGLAVTPVPADIP
jgi:hypothetical protein